MSSIYTDGWTHILTFIHTLYIHTYMHHTDGLTDWLTVRKRCKCKKLLFSLTQDPCENSEWSHVGHWSAARIGWSWAVPFPGWPMGCEALSGCMILLHYVNDNFKPSPHVWAITQQEHISFSYWMSSSKVTTSKTKKSMQLQQQPWQLNSDPSTPRCVCA